jgi:hypothetical protein
MIERIILGLPPCSMSASNTHLNQGNSHHVAINEERLNVFLGKAVGDIGAVISAVLIVLGDEPGLYRELGKGPLTSAELAANTNTNERYIREWLANQAAGGYAE